MQLHDLRRTSRRDARALDASEIEEAAGAPLLARAFAPTDPTMLPALELGAQEADPFRNLVLWWEGEARRSEVGATVVAAVTTRSAGSAPEGGTEAWWAANLAIALAGSGRSTLLVDGRVEDDAASPVGPDGPDTPGLHDVLTGTPFDQAVSPGPTPGLSVMPPGHTGDPAAPGLLHGFAALAQHALRTFDAVVVLAPGLDQSDHAQQMALSSGRLVLVVPAGRGGLSALRQRSARVRLPGHRVAGVVLAERRRARVLQ